MRSGRGISIPFAVAVVVALIIAVLIFVLTEQAPTATATASNAVNDFLVSVFGDVAFLYDAEADLWLGIGIRHWAHAVEFGFLGIFVALAAWFAMRPFALRAGLVSFALCALCSVLDQCHKLFVPGRHFDGFDLAMDALGYSVSILVVLLAARLASRSEALRKRPVQ